MAWSGQTAPAVAGRLKRLVGRHLPRRACDALLPKDSAGEAVGGMIVGRSVYGVCSRSSEVR